MGEISVSRERFNHLLLCELAAGKLQSENVELRQLLQIAILYLADAADLLESNRCAEARLFCAEARRSLDETSYRLAALRRVHHG